MNENLELITEIYNSSNMGVYTTSTLINTLKNKNNKIKKILEDELQEYEKYMKKTNKVLEKKKINIKNNIMAKMMSNIGIKFESLKDNSDSSIAETLIEGFTMGINNIELIISKYDKETKSSYIKLAKKYLKFQEQQIKKLKIYL